MPSNLLLTLFLLCALATLAWAQPPEPTSETLSGADTQRIARLIANLGNDDFAVREASSKALADYGRLCIRCLRSTRMRMTRKLPCVCGGCCLPSVHIANPDRS